MGVGIVEYGRDLPTRYAGFLLAELGAEVTALRGAGDDWHPVLDRRKHRAQLGSVQAYWALDLQMDEAAERLGLDPAALNLRNAVREGDIAPSGHPLVGHVL